MCINAFILKVFVLVWKLSDKIDTATKGPMNTYTHTQRERLMKGAPTHSKCPLQTRVVAARNSTKTNGPQRHRHTHTHAGTHTMHRHAHK